LVFGDLGKPEAKAMGAILRKIDAVKIALGIKGASDGLANKMLGSLSARAAETIRDDIADMGAVKRSDVDEAQKAVIAIARQMAASGEIMLGGKSDDYV